MLRETEKILGAIDVPWMQRFAGSDCRAQRTLVTTLNVNPVNPFLFW